MLMDYQVIEPKICEELFAPHVLEQMRMSETRGGSIDSHP